MSHKENEISAFWEAARDLRLNGNPNAADDLAVIGIYTEDRRLQARINSILQSHTEAICAFSA